MKTVNRLVYFFIITVIILIATPAFAERLKYTGLARSEGGAVLASATVAVYLAGTTTPADVYEASSGGTSVNEVTTDSNGRWTFYADTTDYAFTQEYKVVVTKDGYSSITLDNIFILRLPTNAVGVLTNDGSGNYTWSASSFSESGDYSYGELTTEHVAVWYNDDGTWKLKAGDLPSTDNTTNGKLVKKVVDEGVHTLEDAEAGTDYASPNADTTGTASKLPVNEATDASGEESVDSTSGQYRNYDGTRQNVFSPINSFSIVIPAPADTDDINILKAPYGMTILGIDCIVQGTTSVTGQIQECSSAGASCADLDSDITCDADGAADDGTLTDSAIASGAWLRWKTTSLSGTPTFLTVTVKYKVVAD